MSFWSLVTIIVSLAVLSYPREHGVKDSRHNAEKDNLQRVLGEPIHDATNVKKLHGIKRTTTMHRICLKLRELSKRSRHTKKYLIKHRCGVLSRRDGQYNTQAKKVARIIQNSQKSKASLKEQREQLVREVNNLAKLAGPLPSLKSLKMAG